MRIPFDYNNKVVWSAGSFEVAIANLISSFTMVTTNAAHVIGERIAVWDASIGENGDYGVSYTSIVLNVNSLFGLHCPFDNDEVVMMSWGVQGSVITSFLVFHKVQQPGTNALVTTGFADLFDVSKNAFMGDYSENIESSSYNVNGVDPAAIRVYGMQLFMFYSIAAFPNIIKISTTDGINTAVTKTTNTDALGGVSNVW